MRDHLWLQRRKMRPAFWKRPLPSVYVAGCRKFHGDGKLAGSKIKFYTALCVIAERKALIVSKGYL
jgi:hypothetical protein